MRKGLDGYRESRSRTLGEYGLDIGRIRVGYWENRGWILGK